MRCLFELPNSAQKRILDHLNVIDFPNCRLVCRRFKSLIDRARPVELIVDRSVAQLYENLQWYHTEDRINSRNKVFITDVLLLMNFPFDLTYLKRLKINFMININEFDLSFFANLLDLNQLEIYSIARFLEIKKNDTDRASNSTLHLPAVKILWIGKVLDELYVFAPKLRRLFCPVGSSLIKIKSEMKIKKIQKRQTHTPQLAKQPDDQKMDISKEFNQIIALELMTKKLSIEPEKKISKLC